MYRGNSCDLLGLRSSVSRFSFAVVILDQTPLQQPNHHQQQRPRTTPPDRHFLHPHKPNLASIASPAILQRRPTTAQPSRWTSHRLRLPFRERGKRIKGGSRPFFLRPMGERGPAPEGILIRIFAYAPLPRGIKRRTHGRFESVKSGSLFGLVS